jgi:hypothetical protein
MGLIRIDNIRQLFMPSKSISASSRASCHDEELSDFEPPDGFNSNCDGDVPETLTFSVTFPASGLDSDFGSVVLHEVSISYHLAEDPLGILVCFEGFPFTLRLLLL